MTWWATCASPAAGLRAGRGPRPDRTLDPHPGAGLPVVTLPSYRPWMTGALVYPDVFWALDAVGLRRG